MKHDIIFISYGENNANENWDKLISRFPYAKRITNIKGIYNAYKKAADISHTDFFFIVDADNIILENFNFDFQPRDNSTGTFIWQAKNPVNNLIYGFGGLKLYNKIEFYSVENSLNKKTNSHDFINLYDFPVTYKIKFIKEVASITQFNSSPFDSWKAAFRECSKLITFGTYLNLSQKQLEEDKIKLDVWCTIGGNKPFGEWVILGAKDGKEYGLKNCKSISKIALINDYSWLKNYFSKKYNYVFA